MGKAPTGKQLATELCRKFPDTPSKTLARKLFKEHSERFETLNAAMLQIRRVRGQQGKDNRSKPWSKPAVPKKAGKPGWKPDCPPSFAEPWLPVQIDGPCRVLCLSDVHIPYHSKEAVESAVAYGKKLKPDVVLLNGDTNDFYRISRFQQDPKKRLLKEELDACSHFLSWIRGQFPGARLIFKFGNHEERWNHYLWNKAPELVGAEFVELHNVFKFDELGIERVDDNPIMAGSLPILHGHELQKSLGTPVNQARTAFLKTIHTVLVGHGHRTSTHCEPDMFGREITTWSQGCLCARNPEYARFAKWNWGFAFIEVADDGEFDVNNYRLSNDYRVRTA